MIDKDIKNCGMCKVPFERNNYYNGKLMTARDFRTDQNYFNEKRWLMNRLVHGWGVVCGLDVRPAEEANKVIVTPGFAIDCCGREILVCEDQLVSLELEFSEYDKPVQEGETKFIICIEFRECKTEQVHIPSMACDQKDKSEFNRIRDSFNIRVIPFFEDKIKRKPFCQNKAEDIEKSLHQYLCDRLRKVFPKCPEPQCVILAVVTAGDNKEIDVCSRRKLVYTRSQLYDMLHCFHGDLPHICEINWHYGKEMEWNEFEELVESGLKVTFDKPMNHDSINIHTLLIAVITTDEGTGYRLLKYIPSEGKKIEISNEEIDGRKVTKAKFDFEDEWTADEVSITKKDISTRKHSILSNGAEFEIILRGSSIFSEGEFLFRWNEIPGNDSDRLIEFLIQNYDANWVTKDLVTKSDDKTIVITDGKNSISLERIEEDSKMILTINKNRTDEFLLREEEEKRNIYKKGKALDGSFQGILPSGNGTQGGDFVSWFSVKPLALKQQK